MLSWLLWTAGGGITYLALREAWYSLALPTHAMVQRSQGNLRGAIHTLERVLRAPLLSGRMSKPAARYQLAWLHLDDENATMAESQFRALLDQPCSQYLKTESRKRLADFLEHRGEVEQAEAERDRVVGEIEQMASPGARHLALARFYEETGYDADAFEHYMAALRHISSLDRQSRVEALIRSSMVAYMIGLPREGLKLAHHALELSPPDELAVSAHLAAGIMHAAVFDFDAAEHEHRQALTLALGAGTEDVVGDCLAQLAACCARRGDLVEAMQRCEDAAGQSLKSRRQARLIQAECLRHWGRFDEARDLLQRASEPSSHVFPVHQARMRAKQLIALAWVEMESGSIAAAEEAVSQLDERPLAPRGRIFLRGTQLWIDAVRGRRQKVARDVPELSGGAKDMEQDAETSAAALALIGRAWWELQDYARSLAVWQDLSEGTLAPVMRPTVLYYMGACHLRLGNTDTARAVFHRAVNAGIQTHDARQAAKEIEALDAETGS